MPTLPPPIDAYFAAQASDDAEAVVACFDADAVVRDEAADYRGTTAIRAWQIDTKKRTPFTARPLSSVERGDHCTVKAEVSGAFPGSPVTLDHDFTLRDERIIALEIH